MIQLKENQGIPRSILLMMAIVAGLTVANCYYNQPLLELIRHDLDITEQKANLITVITQIGYALGLFFLIPLGDMLSRNQDEGDEDRHRDNGLRGVADVEAVQVENHFFNSPRSFSSSAMSSAVRPRVSARWATRGAARPEKT